MATDALKAMTAANSHLAARPVPFPILMTCSFIV
jgi:hypothetical protein